MSNRMIGTLILIPVTDPNQVRLAASLEYLAEPVQGPPLAAFYNHKQHGMIAGPVLAVHPELCSVTIMVAEHRPKGSAQ